MNAKDIIESLKVKRNHPSFRVGDTVRIHVKIKEAEKERIQLFEGVVIKRRKSDKGGSFTVRKISYGVGVERIFPFESAVLEKIEVIQRGKVRRGRLFYLRQRSGKAAQIAKDGNFVASDEAEVSSKNTDSASADLKTTNVQENASAVN